MDNEQLALIVIGILGGGFSLAGAIFDWDWFMTNRRARLFVNIFGRTGARIVYVLIGLLLVGLGLGALFMS